MIENRNISISVISGLLRVADVIGVVLAGVLAYYFRFMTFRMEGDYLVALLFVTVAAANTFHILKIYDRDRIVPDPMQLRRLGIGLLIITFLALLVGVFTKLSIGYSRIWMSTWGLLSIIFLVTSRIFLLIRFRRWQARGWLTRRVAIVGAGAQGQRMVSHFASSGDPSVDLIGVFDDRRSRVPNQIGDYPVKGTVDDLMDIVRNDRVDEVIVALPWSAEERLLEIMKKLGTAPVDVRLCPEGVAFKFSSRSFSDVHGISVLNIYDRPMSSWPSVVKSIEDRVLASLILMFVMPLMVIIAIAIKLESPGPILFRQPRYGFNNKLFTMYKFRGFRQDVSDPKAEQLVTRNDPRLTRVGRFLRQSHLDELPQFFNVLKGDMSIVGPRAHGVMAKADGQLYKEVVEEYFARHRVKPGITGWAQVNGWTGNTETLEQIERRVEHDLYYIERWSVWLDLKIIFMTPFAMMFSKSY